MEETAKGKKLKTSSQNKKSWPPKTLTIPAHSKMDFFPYSFCFNGGRSCVAQILDISRNFKCWTYYQSDAK